MALSYRLPLILEEPQSDSVRLNDRTDLSLVMAEKNTRDVVDQKQSVGDLSPSDVPVTNQFDHSSGGDEGDVSSKIQSSGGQTTDSTSFPDGQANGGEGYYGDEKPETVGEVVTFR